MRPSATQRPLAALHLLSIRVTLQLFTSSQTRLATKRKKKFGTIVENLGILGDGVGEMSVSATCRNVFVLCAGWWGWLRL